MLSLDYNVNQTGDMDTNEKPTDTLKTNGHKIVTRGIKGLAEGRQGNEGIHNH